MPILAILKQRIKSACNPAPDGLFLYSVMALIFIGFIMILSTSSVLGHAYYNNGFFFIRKQLFFFGLGLIAMLLLYYMPVSLYKRLIVPGFLASLVLLALTLVPGFGVLLGGASRWLSILGVQFQPIELVKFFFPGIIGLLWHNKRHYRAHFSSIFPILVMAAFPLSIMALQPDLGNSILLSVTAGALLLIYGIRIRHMLVLSTIGLIILTGIIMIYPYQQARLTAFLNPWDDPFGKNYHAVQSMMAIGSGGITGLGLGQSRLKYFYLPLHHSDFIFAIICEEGGLLASMSVLGLFFMMAYRGVRIAHLCYDPVLSVWVMGLTLLLAGQAFLNIGVVIGLFPITGIPLTFISLGGSSLVISMSSAGLIARVSQDARAAVIARD